MATLAVQSLPSMLGSGAKSSTPTELDTANQTTAPDWDSKDADGERDDKGADQFANNGRTFVRIKAGSSAASVTRVRFRSLTKSNQGHTNHVVASVAQNADALIGPFAPGRFNNSSGEVEIDYSKGDDEPTYESGFDALTSTESSNLKLEIVSL